MRFTDIRKIIQLLKNTDIYYISTISKLSQATAKLIIINSSKHQEYICGQCVVQSRTTDHGTTEKQYVDKDIFIVTS